VALDALDDELIRQLYARYSWALDFHDLDGFAACFTEDGSFHGNSVRPGMSGVHTGHEALRAFADNVHLATAGHARHTATNILVEDADEADTYRAVAYFQVTRDYGEGFGLAQPTPKSTLTTTRIYRDVLRRTEGGWKFAERTARYDSRPDVVALVGEPFSFDLWG
jgi:hypothetical protein